MKNTIVFLLLVSVMACLLVLSMAAQAVVVSRGRGFARGVAIDTNILMYHLWSISNQCVNGYYADESIYDNYGTNSDASARAGWTEEGLDFDGINDLVIVAHSPSIAFNWFSKFTFAAWVKTSASGSYVDIITKTDGNISGPYFGKHSTDVLVFQLFHNNPWPSGSIGRKGTVDLADGNWHFVAGSYDGTRWWTGFKLYVDGKADNGANVSAGNFGEITHTGPLTIGGSIISKWNGPMAKPQVWGRVLDTNELNVIYAEGRL